MGSAKACVGVVFSLSGILIRKSGMKWMSRFLMKASTLSNQSIILDRSGVDWLKVFLRLRRG
jgi:hypothetical protein